MYLYYDFQRRLKEIIDEFPLVQYSNQANKIYAYFEGVEPSTLSSVFYKFVLNTKPDPTPITREANLVRKEIPFSDTRDLKYFEYGKEYNFYVRFLKIKTWKDKTLDLEVQPIIVITTNILSKTVYGYAHENGADLIISSPDELISFIKNL